MFPIRWNKAFRKKDGSLTTIDEAIEDGGTPYELPTASAETKGGVKIGSGLSMEGEVLNANGGTLYRHDIIITNGLIITFNFVIISNSAEAFTLSSIATYLYDKGYSGSNSNKYMSAHGVFNNNRYFAIASSNGTDVQAFSAIGSSTTFPSSFTVYDAVIEL